MFIVLLAGGLLERNRVNYSSPPILKWFWEWEKKPSLVLKYPQGWKEFAPGDVRVVGLEDAKFKKDVKDAIRKRPIQDVMVGSEEPEAAADDEPEAAAEEVVPPARRRAKNLRVAPPPAPVPPPVAPPLGPPVAPAPVAPPVAPPVPAAPEGVRLPSDDEAEGGEAVPPAVPRVLGCSKCRYQVTGCKQCKNPGYTPKPAKGRGRAGGRGAPAPAPAPAPPAAPVPPAGRGRGRGRGRG